MTSLEQLVLWAGLFIGLAFGVCGQVTGFCLMRGLKTWWVDADGRKIRAFALAIAVALVGSQALDALGLVTLTQSLYVQPMIAAPAIFLGGLVFGFGMIMANGCGARSLVLLGSGNLRSLLVLLCLGVAAAATLTGLIAPVRLWLQGIGVWSPATQATIPHLVTDLGLSYELARWIVISVLAGGLAIFAFASALFRADWRAVSSGFVIGGLVVAGWYSTGVLGADDFDPAALESLTFIAPIGNSIQYVMLATGLRLSFGVTVVAGVFLGALASALATRTAKLEGFTRPRSILRYAGGGALMGIGGALALGCSIGQGLTGLSTLALGSFVAAAGILAGSALGLRGPFKLAAPQP
ncbi:YeeE/YedE family protein [Pelagibacterium luteolum]|uniref:YeeE/YedE family protein n=1 Tax=Pelagibacterium luteolum TaxID=440168 RepID=UPI003CC7A15A